VGFPNIHRYPESHPGPYERQMGGYIVALLRLSERCVPDAESHTCVAELAANPDRWSASHAVFDEVRHRLLGVMNRGDRIRSGQYHFEESCCQAMYNTTEPPDPFDASSAFFVVAQALGLARLVGVSLDLIAGVFTQIPDG